MNPFSLLLTATLLSSISFAGACETAGRAGQALNCLTTHHYANRSLTHKTVGVEFSDINEDEPSGVSDHCHAQATVTDPETQIKISASADDSALVSITTYINGRLQSPELSAPSIQGSSVSAYYNLNSAPIVDSHGEKIVAMTFSCSVN